MLLIQPLQVDCKMYLTYNSNFLCIKHYVTLKNKFNICIYNNSRFQEILKILSYQIRQK